MLGARGVRPRAEQVAINAIHELVARGRQAGVGLAAAGRRTRRCIAQGQRRWPKQTLRDAYQIRSKQARTQALARSRRRRRRARSPTARRRRSTPARSTTCCSTSKRRSCAARSWPASRASTAATRAPCARSRSAPACCRARTARRCSRAARRRRWSSPRSAPRATRRSSTRSTGEYRDRFMFHYNFPPFATGETGRVGSPKRREIGHGRLAKRALRRRAADAARSSRTRSASSRRSPSRTARRRWRRCAAASLALMDAGVPMKAHVAGIAMGLIKEGNRFAVLTDILGDEDHLGDMDFKVAGTDQRHHRAADGHQDRGHHQGDHAGRAGAGARRPPAHPRQDAGGACRDAAHRDVAASRRA